MGHTRTNKSVRYRFAAAAVTAAFLTAFTFFGAFASQAAGDSGKTSASKNTNANSPQAGVIIYALDELSRHLVSFDSTAPGRLLTDVAITGLESGEVLSGIDFRPATGQLYTVGSSNRVYIINTATGAATPVNAAPFTPNLDLANEYAGFDFNPVADRLRIVTTGGVNIRYNPIDGTVEASDPTPTFAAGDPNAGFPVTLSQLAYTNNVAGATTTTAYAIDYDSDSLVTLGSVNGTPDSPNSGITHTIGSLGVSTASESGGFDIQSGTNTAYASVSTSPDDVNIVSNLYTVNLQTGALTSLGQIGSAANPIRIDGIAIAPSAVAAQPARTLFDFDGDKKADASVYRPNANPDNNYWYILRSGTNSFASLEWGIQTDYLAPADYDGDTKTDIAVYRAYNDGVSPSSYFFIFNSNTNTVRAERFGNPGDFIVSDDYDGDGKADPAVYHPGATAGAQSNFLYIPSATRAGSNSVSIALGTGITAVSPNEVPVRGDFDGDKKADAAIFRRSNQTWTIKNSGDGALRTVQFGTTGDKPVFGDYDGDGKSDIAVYRPASGTWYILQSASSQIRIQQFGVFSDVLVPADYDGDGKTDLAVYRSGLYIILRSVDSTVSYLPWGVSGDIPAAASYNR